MEQPLEKIRAPARLQKIAAQLGKYKYALLVLLLGIVLALIPTGGKQQSAASAPDTRQAELSQLEETREALRALLRQVDGAGEVDVLLSYSAGAEQVYQTDRESSRSGEDTQQKTTAVLQQSGSERTPVVRKTLYPVYQGAVVVCEGAERAAVRLAIVEAVSSLTGLGSDKISVIKMKSK